MKVEGIDREDLGEEGEIDGMVGKKGVDASGDHHGPCRGRACFAGLDHGGQDDLAWARRRRSRLL